MATPRDHLSYVFVIKFRYVLLMPLASWLVKSPNLDCDEDCETIILSAKQSVMERWSKRLVVLHKRGV